MKSGLYEAWWLAGVMVGNIFTMDLQKQAGKCGRLNGQYYSYNSFHALVTNDHLNISLLKSNAFVGVNYQDIYGWTPLHYLAVRKDSTIEDIEALLARGADPTIRTNIRKNGGGYLEKGYDVYRNALKYGGISPVETFFKYFEDQFFGNKEVRNYIFCVILHKKLSDLALQKEREAGRQWQKQDLKARQEKWASVPLWRQIDV